MVLRSFLILFVHLLTPIIGDADIGSNNENSLSNQYLGSTLSINKISFTQKGYLQFLKYMVDVPPISEYTFCVWLKSENLTHNHPLLSYSLHDKDRLISAWITPFGHSFRLDILDRPIFDVPLGITEHVWHHLCQSWSGVQGVWSIYVNGQHVLSGHEPSLQGVSIPPGGDLVVGQEYTDFDKGLDDGIEGDISGFNMVLSSTTSHYLPPEYHRRVPTGNIRLPVPVSINNASPSKANFGHGKYKSYRVKTSVPFKHTIDLDAPRRMSKSILGMLNIFSQQQRKTPTKILKPRTRYRPNKKRFHPPPPIRRNLNNIVEGNGTPLGLQLVQLSYDCTLNKGAPLENKHVLVSWSKTGVRVFGGAVLAKVKPFCV